MEPHPFIRCNCNTDSQASKRAPPIVPRPFSPPRWPSTGSKSIDLTLDMSRVPARPAVGQSCPDPPSDRCALTSQPRGPVGRAPGGGCRFITRGPPRHQRGREGGRAEGGHRAGAFLSRTPTRFARANLGRAFSSSTLGHLDAKAPTPAIQARLTVCLLSDWNLRSSRLKRLERLLSICCSPIPSSRAQAEGARCPGPGPRASQLGNADAQVVSPAERPPSCARLPSCNR